MPIEQLIALALIQGLTEFLPVSSSGHLILVNVLTDWQDQGALIDVAVHVGSLFAVLAYFHRDVAMLLSGALKLVTGRMDADARLLAILAVATLPVLAVGFVLVRTGAVQLLRTAEVIAWANLVFAGVLYASDRIGALGRTLEDTGWRDGILVGLAQAIALIPGASRSGITISAARFLGYERTEAARLSMLLSIPTIAALGLATAYELYRTGNAQAWDDAGLAALLSFVSAFISVWFMMALLRRMTLLPFVVYRVVLGVALLAWVYS